MMSVIRFELAVARPISTSRSIDRLQVGARDMRQDQVLLVADADLVEGIFLGEVGDRLHLAVAGVARHLADALQRDRHRRIVGMAVRDDVLVEPSREALGIEPRQPHGLVAFRPRGKRRRREIGVDGADVGLRQLQLAVLQRRPLGLDLAREFLGAGLVHQDLDARLVLVVAAAVEVVHAHDRGRVGEQVLLRQEVADLLGDHRRAALAAADIDGKAQLALVVLLQMQADVVDLDRGAVALGAGHRDLELARQVGEFRVHRRPLAQDLGIGPRIGDLVGGGAGEMVGGDVADAVAARSGWRASRRWRGRRGSPACRTAPASCTGCSGAW